MKDSLLSETLGYYKKVDSIYNSTGYRKSYKLNAFWGSKNMQDMLEILNNSGTAVEAIHSVQKTWMFSVNTSEPIKAKAVDWLLADQQKRNIDLFDMDASIAESRFSNTQNNILRKGRILTPDFLRTINITHEIKKYCKIGKSKLHIIELGAGCGHLARTLRLFMPNCCYVIIDIPESLCFSYMFLKLNFPDARTFYVTDEKQLKEHAVSRFDYIFIPTKFAECVLKTKFDLFINTASLGEMKNPVICYWMDFVQNKLKVKYLFTLNRYLNTIRTDGNGRTNWRLDENECSVLYDANWKILNWDLEPPFTRCPYLDTLIARYLEIVAKKISPIPIGEREKRSQQLVSEVMDEDWIRLEKSCLPTMTYRDNILVNDMTMNGTLFKLWESIRLYPNEANTALMLKYLETLIHRQDKEFEETYYYENLFNRLFVSRDNKDLLKIHNVIEEKHHHIKSWPRLMPSFFPADLEPPFLIEEGYRNFNIVKYKGDFHAISRDLGPFDIAKKNNVKQYEKNSKYFVGRSYDEVRRLVVQSQCEALQKNLEDRDKTTVALQTDISKKNEEIERLSGEILQRDESIAKLNANVMELNKRIDSLQSNISERDKTIETLNKEISVRDINIDNLSANIKVLNKRIDTLQSDSAQRDKSIEALNKEISGRDGNINKLNADVKELNKTIAGLRTDISARDENTVMLSANIDKCNKTIDSLRSDISARNEDIAKLKADIEKRNNSIDSLQTAVSERDESIEALNNEIAKRDENIAKLNIELTKNVQLHKRFRSRTG